jgi:hypothetical protein
MTNIDREMENEESCSQESGSLNSSGISSDGIGTNSWLRRARDEHQVKITT